MIRDSTDSLDVGGLTSPSFDPLDVYNPSLEKYDYSLVQEDKVAPNNDEHGGFVQVSVDKDAFHQFPVPANHDFITIQNNLNSEQSE